MIINYTAQVTKTPDFHHPRGRDCTCDECMCYCAPCVNRRVGEERNGKQGRMRRFRCYRPIPPGEYYEQGIANAPDEVQFEGVQFSDGTCCVRWLTQFRSHSLWASWKDLEKVHGHPEYGTRIEWLD